MKLNKWFIFLIIIAFIASCTGFYISPSLVFYNRSKLDLIVLANFNYPDTSVEQSRIMLIIGDWEWGYSDERYYWTRRMNESGKVTIFFMPKALLDEHGEEEAKNHFKPTEKYILSLEDLEAADWKIYFPYELNKTFKPVPHP